MGKLYFLTNGNMTSITPPSRPNHSFTYTPVNLEDTYNSPSPLWGEGGGEGWKTLYSYNLDKQLTIITRPDGQTVSLDYNTGGRLSAITQSVGQGLSLAYTYDGSLLKGTTWTGNGSVSGSVSFTYNNDFRITSESVNGANSVSYLYDNDGLLTGAGSLTIGRNTQNGLITGTTLGSTTTGQSYNGFGELSQYTASYSGSSFFDVQYTRDSLGRITQKFETIAGVPSTFTYTYDLAGRLTGVSKDGVSISQYSYDSNSNRTSYVGQDLSLAGTYDVQDRLLTYGNNTYTYTTNGELLTKTSNGQTTTYNYDVLGNLVSSSLPDGTLIEYVIDGRIEGLGKR